MSRSGLVLANRDQWGSAFTFGTTSGLPVEATQPATPSPIGIRSPFSDSASSPTAMT